jgi:hypothetical protein
MPAFIQSSGLNYKTSVRAASIADVNLSAPGAAMDGVALAVGNRILIKDQTDPIQNGIYVWASASAALVRSADASSFLALESAIVIVTDGAFNGGSRWVQTATAGIINVAAIYWTSDGQSGPPAASETTAGIAEIATQAEVNAGTAADKIVTPVTLKNIASDLDFNNARRITNLPPAIAPGQPATYEQLGGGITETVVLALAEQAQSAEWTITRPGTTAAQTVKAWLTDHLDNELWQLETATIVASCSLSAVTFYFSSQYFEFGNIKVNFEVK